MAENIPATSQRSRTRVVIKTITFTLSVSLVLLSGWTFVKYIHYASLQGYIVEGIKLALDSKQATFEKGKHEAIENDTVELWYQQTRPPPHDDTETGQRHEIRHPKDQQARKNLSEQNGRETSTHPHSGDRQ